MASQAYRDWLKAGKPYTLIRPAKALQKALQVHGLTVWDYPNDAHLKAGTPEDHTPFSATGWPNTNRRWKARGLDVMPRSSSLEHRRENADIARRLIRDRDAGVPAVMWIKYLNWTDENGACRQERWTTAGKPLQRTTKSSTDKGHIHVSGRSDADDDPRADGYDPLSATTPSPAATGDDVSKQTDDIIAAWMNGVPSVPGFGPLAAISFEAERQKWQAVTTATLTALAADARAGRVAVEALAKALNGTGGSVDSASVIAHMDLLAAAEVAREQQLLARIAELEAAAVANLSPAERAVLGTT